MLLSDIVAEYNEAITLLNNAQKFHVMSKDLIQLYIAQYSSMTQTFYTQKMGSPKEALATALNNFTQKFFDQVVLLNTASRELNQCIGSIQNIKWNVPNLESEINILISSARLADDDICKIMEAKLADTRKGNLFSSLISHLDTFNISYDSILNTGSNLKDFNELLLEPILDSIPENNYTDFSLNSLEPSKDFDQITSSLENFSDVYENISRLKEVPLNEKYYIRRIETGSLGIIITCIVPVAIAIGKFIDFCFQRYITYKKSRLEIQSMRQEIVKNDLDILIDTLELNPNLENKQELIEKASGAAFKYFNSNPQFKMNDKIYDCRSEQNLLEEKDFEREK